MGIKLKGKAKATKLWSSIATYLFEEECGELRNKPNAVSALHKAQEELIKIIKSYG